MNLPAGFVAISLGLAGIAWLFFARSQSGRKQAVILKWLALPYFIGCGMYIYFSVFDVDIFIRSIYGRFGFVAISLPTAILLFYLSYINRDHHG